MAEERPPLPAQSDMPCQPNDDLVAGHEKNRSHSPATASEAHPRQAATEAQLLDLQQDNARLVAANIEAQTLAEQKQIEGEQRYRTLLEALDEGFCIIEKIGDGTDGPLDFRFIEANPAYTAQSGISDVVGKTLREVVPLDADYWLSTYDAVLTSGEPIKFVRELVNQGRLLELHAFRIDPIQNRVGVSSKDISERRRTSALLRRNHDTLVSMIENAPFGMYVVDAEFRMWQVSKASQSAFSNTSPLIGRDFGEVMHILWDEGFANEAIRRFRHTLQTGEPYVALNMTEQRHNIPEIQSYDWMIERITLPDGQFGVVCYFYDITERKRAEDALRESEAFNRSIIESSPDCIKVLDLEGKLLSMHSGQELLGIEDIQPFLNTSWLAFWEGQHREAAQAAITFAAAGEAANFVGFFRTLRGEPKWWDVAVSPILDADDKPVQLLAVSRDVSQRRQAEMNLAFLASVSSDLVHWSNVDEMMQTVGAKMAAYLQLSLCAFAEIDEAAEQVVIQHGWHRQGVPSLVGVYRLADFVEEEFIRVARAAEVIVIPNVAMDSRTDRKKFAALNIVSFVCVPLIQQGQWRFALCLYKDVAYDWREDEIELARELTARIWTRLERLRAEAALRESEARFRAAVNTVSSLIWTNNAEGLMEGEQPGWGNFTGQTQAEYQAYGWSKAVHPEDAQPTIDAWMQAVAEKRLFEFEHRIRRRDGEWRLCSIRAVPLLGGDGNIREWVGVHTDITERKRSEVALRESERRYRNLFNSIDEGFCIIEVVFDDHQTPVDWVFLEVNPAFEKQTGMFDIVGKRVRELIPDHEAYWYETYGKVCLTGEPIRFINEAKAMNNTWFDLFAFRVGGHGSRKVAVVFTNITERKLAEKALADSLRELRETEAALRVTQAALSKEKAALADHVAQLQQVNEHLLNATSEAQNLAAEIEKGRAHMAHLAQHDSLTKLPNRMLLNDRLAQAILLADRHGKSFALMFLDLDRFKYVNDSLGHAVGDQLLQSVAERLAVTVRGSDTLCRLGGDEFVILLADLEHAEDAALSAQKILDVLAPPHRIEQFALQITVSIGISIYPQDGLNADDLIRNADSAMYRAKASGRNNWRFFSRYESAGMA